MDVAGQECHGCAAGLVAASPHARSCGTPSPQAKEKDELAARAKGDMVLGLLPLVDNFELARTQVGGAARRGWDGTGLAG